MILLVYIICISCSLKEEKGVPLQKLGENEIY